jgi:hypothetical protein
MIVRIGNGALIDGFYFGHTVKHAIDAAGNFGSDVDEPILIKRIVNPESPTAKRHPYPGSEHVCHMTDLKKDGKRIAIIVA